MKPISKVPTKAVPLKMGKILAENQNEIVDRVNFLSEQVAILSKPKAKSKPKGDKR